MTYEEIKKLVNQSRRIAKKLKPPGLCEKCGVKRGTDVHHRDMNPFNNSTENLQRLCAKCHAASHGPVDDKSLGWWMKVLDIPCLTPIQQHQLSPEGIAEEVQRIASVIEARQRTVAADLLFEAQVKTEREAWQEQARSIGAYDLVAQFQKVLDKTRAKNGFVTPAQANYFSIPLPDKT